MICFYFLQCYLFQTLDPRVYRDSFVSTNETFFIQCRLNKTSSSHSFFFFNNNIISFKSNLSFLSMFTLIIIALSMSFAIKQRLFARKVQLQKKQGNFNFAQEPEGQLQPIQSENLPSPGLESPVIPIKFGSIWFNSSHGKEATCH